MSAPPRLSQSIASVLLQQSPLHAWWRHRELGKQSIASPSMDQGSLIHELLLGGDKVCIVDHENWRTKKAREQRDSLYAQGLVPILRHQYNGAKSAAESIRSDIQGESIDLDSYVKERKLQWTQDGVDCEGTPDGYKVDGEWIDMFDLKTTGKSADEKYVSNSIVRWSIQHAAYTSAMKILHPECSGRIRWVWIVVESEHPYGVTIVDPDSLVEQLGYAQWSRALRIWKGLIESGWGKPWRGYGRITATAPSWALMREEEQDGENI